MSGAPSDSYGGGLFRTASAGNLSRRLKALQRSQKSRIERRKRAGRTLAITQRGKARGPYKSPKRDEVAELLSQGFELDAIAVNMGLTAKAVRKHFDAIRKQLGPQAV